MEKSRTGRRDPDSGMSGRQDKNVEEYVIGNNVVGSTGQMRTW